MKSGQDFTQLSIRFGASDIGQVGDVKYRRAAPSRLLRDKQRAGILRSQYQQQDIETQTVCDAQASNTADTHTVSDIFYEDIVANKECAVLRSCTVSSPPQVATTSSTATDAQGLPATTAAKAPTGVSGCINTVSHENLQAVGEGVKTPNSDTEEEVADGTYSCDGCGRMMSCDKGAIMHRFTECQHDEFCTECFRKEIHGHHKQHMRIFHCPGDWDQPYCDSCGYSFKNDMRLWRCSVCEDYCLCFLCQRAMMHTKHDTQLENISVQDYKDELG